MVYSAYQWFVFNSKNMIIMCFVRIFKHLFLEPGTFYTTATLFLLILPDDNSA